MKKTFVIIGVLVAVALGVGLGLATSTTAQALEVPPPNGLCPGTGGSPICVQCLSGKTCVYACRGAYFCRRELTFDGKTTGCYTRDNACITP